MYDFYTYLIFIFSSSFLAGSPNLRSFEEMMKAKREEALQTKRQVEMLKEHYGPNYLQVCALIIELSIDNNNIRQILK